MPTYEYACEKCGKHFEQWQRISEPPVRQCIFPDCKGPVYRVIGGGEFILKGSGFYATDYRSGEYREKQKKESEPAKPADSEPKKKNAAETPKKD